MVNGMTAKISMLNDTVTRTIFVRIELEPDDRSWDLKDLTVTWRDSKPFAPDSTKITLRDGKLSSVKVSGPQVLKGGRLSPSLRDSMVWRPGAFAEAERIENAPEWVRLLVHGALAGLPAHRRRGGADRDARALGVPAPVPGRTRSMTERKPIDGTAVILHLIEAARVVTKDHQSEIDPRDFRRLARWCDELEGWLERITPPVGWEPRTWKELEPGDTVSVGGVEAVVESAMYQSWHVNPKSNEYRPTALEHDVVKLKLEGRPKLYDMPPDGEVEVLRGPIGQEKDRLSGRRRAQLQQEHDVMLERWADEAAQTIAAAGLGPVEVVL